LLQNPVLRPAREMFYDKCFVFESWAMPSGRGRNFFKIPLQVAEIGTIFDGGARTKFFQNSATGSGNRNDFRRRGGGRNFFKIPLQVVEIGTIFDGGAADEIFSKFRYG
jgi:hypothetical protein